MRVKKYAESDQRQRHCRDQCSACECILDASPDQEADVIHPMSHDRVRINRRGGDRSRLIDERSDRVRRVRVDDVIDDVRNDPADHAGQERQENQLQSPPGIEIARSCETDRKNHERNHQKRRTPERVNIAGGRQESGR